MNYIFSSVIGVLSQFLNKFILALDNLRVYFSPKVVSIKLIGQKIKLSNATKDNLTSVLIKNYGVWEVDELNLFSVLCKGSKNFIDIGSNIGLYSILAEKFNPNIKTFAFEPAPSNAKRLLENLKLNNINSCKLIQNAVGDIDGSVSFFVPSDNSSTSVSSTSEIFTSSWHNKPIEISVPIIKLDTFIKRELIKKVDLIKLDAEYYEVNVLNGARELLISHQPAVLCEVNIYEILSFYLPDMKNKISKTLSYDIEEFFKSINYYIYSIGKDGIMYTESVHIHPDVRNFLFSTVKAEKLFIPYSDEENILSLINKI